jgi:hypothetical protein
MIKVLTAPHVFDPKNKSVRTTPFTCERCKGYRIGPNRCGELVCYACGMVKGPSYENEVSHWFLVTKHTYKRIFYFNERCARWTCTEPSITPDIWQHIILEAKKFGNYGHINTFVRGTISKILRNVNLPSKLIRKHKSQKFKCNEMTKKRFYDKYFEKWKTILERLGKKVRIPSLKLVLLLKELFPHTLIPFEYYRHSPNCTKIHNCSKYYGCLKNFINYDFVFRMLLIVAEMKFGHVGCYDEFKDDFPLVSIKIRKTKLHPIWNKICNYNQWPFTEDY